MPCTEAVTIASARNRVFRREYLKPNTIGIIPRNGYRLSENPSKVALQWLISEELEHGILIEHVGRGKLIILGTGLKVVGYYALEKLIFEFFGCFWHGCELCYRTKRDKCLYTTSKESLNLRIQRTNVLKLRTLGFNVIVTWECEFNRKLKSDKDLKKIVENHSLLNYLPLRAREAFFGGRTGNISLYRQAEGDEKIKYVDVCSLYPYVCKYGKYPVGHLKVLVGTDCQEVLGPENNRDNVASLIKCTILPPTDLFHPVLPRKVHNKLMFALCRTCCNDLEQNECTHTIEDRMFIGTWVADEVRRAVKLGYKILDVHEIWQYEVTVFDKQSNTGGLFVEYINYFL